MTRPEPDASRSADRLRKMGHEVLVDPVLVVAFLTEAIDWKVGTDIVVTSRNGVRALASLATDEMREQATVFVVGDATEDLARDCGFINVYSASGTVDQLILLIGSKNVSHLLYVCSRHRQGELEQKLAVLGITVDVAERYETRFSTRLNDITCDALKSGDLDGVLLYSRRSAKAFHHLVDQHKFSCSTEKLTYFCLAKSVTSVFDNMEAVELVIAAFPTEKSLFEALSAS